MGGYIVRKDVFVDEAAAAYQALVRRLYVEPIQQARVVEIQQTLAPSSPFSHFGSWRQVVIDDGRGPAAHAAAIVDRRLPSGIGIIGFFEAVDPLAGRAALRAASEILVSQGAQTVRGPINGSIWQTFRVSFPDRYPPFSLEPYTPAFYRDAFRQEKFTAVHHNVSTEAPLEVLKVAAFDAAAEQLKSSGVTLLGLTSHNVAQDGPMVHELMTTVFRGAWSYVEPSFEEMAPSLTAAANGEPLSVFAVNQQGRLVGLSYGVADSVAPDLRRIVIKTTVVHPEFRHRGIAKAMFSWTFRRARELGFRTCVFSTMRPDNQEILRLTARAREIRRYEAFERRL